MTDRAYYVCAVRRFKKSLFYIWFTNSHDGVVCQSGGLPWRFETEDGLRAAACEIGLEVEPELPVTLDLDLLAAWLLSPKSESIKESGVLDAWNLFDDLARSDPSRWRKFAESSDQNKDGRAYSEVFRVEDLPAMKLTDKEANAPIEKSFIMIVAELLRDGMRVYDEHLARV